MNWWLRVICGLLLTLASAHPARTSTPDFDFEKTIAPILAKNCLNCHNGSEPKGNLDLSRQETAAKGGKTRAALVPGKANDSFLIERVAKGSMPPKKGGRQLSEEEVASLRTWVDAGAKWPAGRVLSPFEFTTEQRAGLDWWAFQPVSRPTIPVVANQDW